MRIKRTLVHINKALTILTGSLLFLLVSIPIFSFKSNRKKIRIPLGVNVVVLVVVLLIIAAYGGAFDKPQSETTASISSVISN